MISVVVPAYQEQDTIVQWLIDLYASQQIEECVVVDASEKQVIVKLKQRISEHEFSGLQYQAAQNKGRAAQMNQGAAISTGEALLFLHADTVLPKGALLRVQASLDAGEKWGRFDVRFDNPAPQYRLIARMMNWRSRISGIATGDQAIFMTRAAFDQAGGFEGIALMEDIAMSKKLKALDLPVCLRDQVQTSARRWEQNGVLKTIILMWGIRLAYWLGVSPDRLVKWYR